MPGKAPGIRQRQRMLFVVLSAALLGGCHEADEVREDSGREAAAVRSMIVNGEDFHPEVVLLGRVEASATAEVRPRTDGIIEERLFAEGGEVRRGDVLYRLDDQSAGLALEAASADVLRARVALEEAQSQLARRQGLVRRGATSREDLETSRFAVEERRAELARAVADERAAALRLDRTRIRAPIDGVIGAALLTPGALVTAAQTEPLAVIQDVRRVCVNAALPGRSRLELGAALRPGMSVELLADGASPVGGRLVFVDHREDPSTGTVKARACADNADGVLLPGMLVRMRMRMPAEEGVVLLPGRAVTTDREGGGSVWVVEETDAGKVVRLRKVRIRGASEGRLIVGEGLVPGDRVVTAGMQNLEDGMHVEESSAPALGQGGLQEAGDE